MTGTVGILNVGAGDTKLSFDPKNPAERIRAARIVRDMLRRGYALLVEVAPGEYQRATDFDEARCEYIIADFDPVTAAEADAAEAAVEDLTEARQAAFVAALAAGGASLGYIVRIIGVLAAAIAHGRIQGVPRLSGCTHQVVADRIEAGTFLCAVAATGGEALLRHGRADHLDAVIDKLRDAGVQVEAVPEGIRVRAQGRPTAQSFRTTEYPGFPTDMQAQFMALNAIAQGSSLVTETIFENRFMHVNELVRLGAKIQVDGKSAIIEGVPQLSGATVMATDLRASASLVIAGLVAEGETVVDRIYHLDRGYDRMEVKLRALGADIERVK